MAKQNLNIGSSANDGTGDSLRDGAIKLNSVIDELYTNLGNDTNLQINVGSPTTGQFLKWNGSQFAEGALDSLTADLDVAGNKIISSSSGDITIQPNGTGDIKFWGGGTGNALTYIDGDDGKLKYSNHFAASGDLPDNVVHHGMFAYVSGDTTARVATAGGWKKLIGEDHSIGDLGDVDLTVGGGASDGQVLKWDGTNSYWYPANDETASGGGGGTTQNLFETINADSGTTTASAATDTLTIAGGTNISTSIAGDTVTIAMTGSLGAPDQNVFTVIGTDNNSKTASSTTTTINFIGGTGVSTDVAGDNLTITNTSPNVVQNVIQSISGDSGSYTSNSSTGGVEIMGGNGVTTGVASNTLLINAELFMQSGFSVGENKALIFGSNGVESVASGGMGWNIGANGSSAYRFTGPGVNSSTDNPTLYLYRGFTYRFANDTGASHPFAIRVSAGGAAVTDGVSGNQEGVQYYTVPMSLSAGTTYKYQCTVVSHAGMIGDLVIV
jgi:hypothetical protein|tara:strand:- start:20 stop:1513 length:1494 start_codon:yes stop_codon:yes gene_type:complete